MMSFLGRVYTVYLKVTPKFIQVMIHPFWCLFFVIPEGIINSVFCRKMAVGWKRTGFVYKSLSFDYVRLSSLELVSREIYENNIQGNVAELGVYQGDFAKHINQIFPNKKLYLFDTFEGFSENDVRMEKSKGLYEPEYTFKSTSVNTVLKKMKYKENIIICKGYFPETAKKIDDTFAFVNIDVDLSEPIYNGLCWFYPRLEKGGYIFVHDFNNKIWTGAKAGVKRFIKEYGVPCFPLSDNGGSVVFMK
jgi:O-methyltransferase